MEEALAFSVFFFQDNVRQTLARFLLELAGEAQAAKEQPSVLHKTILSE